MSINYILTLRAKRANYFLISIVIYNTLYLAYNASEASDDLF